MIKVVMAPRAPSLNRKLLTHLNIQSVESFLEDVIMLISKLSLQTQKSRM